MKPVTMSKELEIMQDTTNGGLVKAFRLIWSIVKLNLFFVLFTLMGGGLLGIGPAFQTISDLIAEDGLAYENQGVAKAFQCWKRNFKRGNLRFYSFFLLFAVVCYNLYLSSQIQGLLWLMIDFLLVTVSVVLTLLYLYSLVFESTYETSLFNTVKLAFISLFFNFGTFAKVIFGIVGILVFTWTAKGLLLFATFSLIILWVQVATRKDREQIDGKLNYE
jgi:uncharacterized membrane protein YesL